jgi:hypothetical protein
MEGNMDDAVRGAVGLFHNEIAIRDAVDELLLSGFDRADLSVLAGDRTIQRRLGHRYMKVTELEDLPLLAAQPYVGPDSRTEASGVLIGGPFYVGACAAAAAIVASGGSLLTVLLGVAAAGGAGGAIGAAIVKYIGRRHARYLESHLNRGGLLLWVHTDHPEHERSACEILRRHSAEDAHLHELPRLSYRMDGGASYDLSFMNRIGL